MNSVIEYRLQPEGITADANVLRGTVMQYGSEAKLGPTLKERFGPGAFGDAATLDVVFNVGHVPERVLGRTGPHGNVALRDVANRVDFEARLPDTALAQETRALIDVGVYRGLSVEFIARHETFPTRHERVITRADLRGFALVQRPAYSASELREIEARFVPPSPKRTTYIFL